MRIFFTVAGGAKYPSMGYQIMSAFQKAGHKIKAFDYRKWKLQHFSLTNKILNKVMIKKVEDYNPDLFLVFKGESILPGTVEEISKKGIKTASWNLDEPFGHLDSFNKIENVDEYDAYFIYDEQYVKPLKKLNPHTHHLPAGADPFGVHKEKIPLEKRKFPADICLVGTAYENRINLMKPFSDYSLNLAGPKWDKSPKKLAEQALPTVSSTEMIKLYNQSKIILNPYGESKYFIVPNPRTFEIPASRSFQLTNMPRDVEKYFEPGKEIVVYKNKKELKEKIEYYTEHDKERNRIAQAGYDRVVKEHTIKHRIEKMLKIMKLD